MKRFFAMLAAVMLCACVLVTPAEATSAASRVDVLATVNSEGDCLVSMTVSLRLEAAGDSLSYPLPLGAKDITLNGGSVSTRRTASAIEVDISRITRDYVGDASLRFDFTLPQAVKVDAENWNPLKQPDIKLTLPLLSGFSYPVELLSFTVNMPSHEITERPEFTSIYRQSSIASDLNYIISASQIIGSSKTVLNDHEGVTMTLLVPQSMFPSVSTYIRQGEPELVPMLITAGVALLYWLLTLFNKPMHPSKTTVPPSGITAGEMGCRLTLAGSDLTMMVFTWAQLGYILIVQEESGRVLLHKRMDMGNERSPHENKIFKGLFGNRRVIDATGNNYAKYCNQVATQISSERTMYRFNSGNMKLFRWICCASHVFCGICVAMNMASNVTLQVVMAIILGIFAFASAWMIQEIAYRTHLRGKTRVYMGLVCVLIWILLGILCGQPWIPLGSVLAQWVFGYFAAYGGRRSDVGRRDANLVLGFRRYVKHIPKSDVNRLLMNDPDYFFNLAPYALALGVINPFAATFVRRKMDQCPYLTTPVYGKRTAPEWAKILVQVADAMDAKSRKMLVEKYLNIRLPEGGLNSLFK